MKKAMAATNRRVWRGATQDQQPFPAADTNPGRKRPYLPRTQAAASYEEAAAGAGVNELRAHC